MATRFSYSHILPLFLLPFISFTFHANSIYFKYPNFGPGDPNILCLGSAGNREGEVDFNLYPAYASQFGRSIYAQKVLLWDSGTSQLTDFTTRYTFMIDTQG